jgi:hypothetical protein
MRLLEVGVGPVQPVTDPVLPETGGLGPESAGDRHVPCSAGRSDPVFVDVVIEVHDHVEILFGHPVVGGVEARLPVLAGSEGEPQLLER